MLDSIAKEALRISLFQTVPGEELSVQKRLALACKKAGIKNKVFLKALGTFDIALVYTTEDYDISLSNFGPVPRILKSNHLLCYSYKNNDAKSVLDLLRKCDFAGFSLLKIDPSAQNAYPGIERALRQLIKDRGENWSVIGAIGWNEIILIITGRDINLISSELIRLSFVHLKEQNIPVLAKTLTFLCMNYKHMPSQKTLGEGFDQTHSYLERLPFLRDVSILPRKRANLAFLETTAKPMYATKIKEYFNDRGFRSNDLLGKSDLTFEPKVPMSWGKFLAAVLHFRHHFADKAFSTSIRLRVSEHHKPVNYTDTPWKSESIKYSFNRLRKDYGGGMATSLANHFNSFNSLIQNPIYGSAFMDMADYPKHILRISRSVETERKLKLMHGAREVIRQGSEIRLCGTFQSIEEEIGKFSEIQGGGQRALLALEFFPSSVLKRLDKTWNGFIITTNYDKLVHVNEVIHVPTNMLWKPQGWWTLYHEIGHILIDSLPDLVSFKVPSVRQFLTTRVNANWWLNFLTELTAEVIGFELGFFDDYELFLSLYWNHINKIDAVQKNMFNIGDYAMRSFFTQIFLQRFVFDQITKEQFLDPDFLYSRFIDHLQTVDTLQGAQKMPSGTMFPDRYFLAAEKVSCCADLYNFSEHLFNKLDHLSFKPPKDHITSKNTEQVVDSLSRDRIWWDKITCPEAVLYRLLKMKPVGFAPAIAAVITFWNQQLTVLKERYR